MILLAGGSKKTQPRDILTAKRRWKDFKNRRQKAHNNHSMPLSRDFTETVRERARRQPKFRRALLKNAVEVLLSGEVETGKALLRRYVNATVGFKRLARELGKHEKSLMQMLSPAGNPQARNLFGMIEVLQRLEGVEFGIVVNDRGRAA